MQILLRHELVDRVAGALRRAGRNEVGGMLMGEHLGEGRFRVEDLSIQTSGGGAACFVRDPREHEAFTRAFFERTSNDYSRFNYLGEWHSHPNHFPLPSATDHRSMGSIVARQENGPLFAVLLIFRMDRRQVAVSATAYRRNARPESVDLVIEGAKAKRLTLVARLKEAGRVLAAGWTRQSNTSGRKE